MAGRLHGILSIVGSTDQHLVLCPLNPRHDARGQAAIGVCRRYVSPRAIMAQMIRAILLARATAASLRGLRSSKASSHADAPGRPGLAWRMTDVAPCCPVKV